MSGEYVEYVFNNKIDRILEDFEQNITSILEELNILVEQENEDPTRPLLNIMNKTKSLFSNLKIKIAEKLKTIDIDKQEKVKLILHKRLKEKLEHFIEINQTAVKRIKDRHSNVKDQGVFSRFLSELDKSSKQSDLETMLNTLPTE